MTQIVLHGKVRTFVVVQELFGEDGDVEGIVRVMPDIRLMNNLRRRGVESRWRVIHLIIRRFQCIVRTHLQLQIKRVCCHSAKGACVHQRHEL